MRVPLLIAAILAVSACGKNDQAGTGQNIEEGLTAQSIASNDVTAIDAVTGDASNMAADVDMNFGNLDEESGAASNDARPSKPRPVKTAPAKSPLPAQANTAAADAPTNAE